MGRVKNVHPDSCMEAVKKLTRESFSCLAHWAAQWEGSKTFVYGSRKEIDLGRLPVSFPWGGPMGTPPQRFTLTRQGQLVVSAGRGGAKSSHEKRYCRTVCFSTPTARGVGG